MTLVNIPRRRTESFSSLYSDNSFNPNSPSQGSIKSLKMDSIDEMVPKIKEQDQTRPKIVTSINEKAKPSRASPSRIVPPSPLVAIPHNPDTLVEDVDKKLLMSNSNTGNSNYQNNSEALRPKSIKSSI